MGVLIQGIGHGVGDVAPSLKELASKFQGKGRDIVGVNQVNFGGRRERQGFISVYITWNNQDEVVTIAGGERGNLARLAEADGTGLIFIIIGGEGDFVADQLVVFIQINRIFGKKFPVRRKELTERTAIWAGR